MSFTLPHNCFVVGVLLKVWLRNSHLFIQFPIVIESKSKLGLAFQGKLVPLSLLTGLLLMYEGLAS